MPVTKKEFLIIESLQFNSPASAGSNKRNTYRLHKQIDLYT
jgi:hypothetical protein